MLQLMMMKCINKEIWLSLGGFWYWTTYNQKPSIDNQNLCSFSL